MLSREIPIITNRMNVNRMGGFSVAVCHGLVVRVVDDLYGDLWVNAGIVRHDEFFLHNDYPCAIIRNNYCVSGRQRGCFTFAPFVLMTCLGGAISEKKNHNRKNN